MLKVVKKAEPSKGLWLVGDKFKIGSHQDNDLQIGGKGVRSYHAEIHIGDNDQLSLQCQPGTCFVNDMPVDTAHPLGPGDELRIGGEILLIQDPKQQPEPAAPAKSPATARKASPAASGWILKALHPQLNNKRFGIRNGAVIGRSKECVISIPYKRMSRRHAEFSVSDGQLHVKDLQSANGTFVNGEKITATQLHGGDKISFAQLEFAVQAPAEMEKTMIRPALNIEEALAAQKQRQATAAEIDAANELQMELTGSEFEAQEASAPEAPPSRRGALIGVAITLALALAGSAYWWLSQ